MPRRPPTPRRVVSVTMTEDLHQRLLQRCAELDKPLTVFAREAIAKALDAAD